MNTTHTNKMNNAKSTMVGELIGRASKALRGLLLRMDATVAEKAEATPVPTKNSAAVPERKCAAAGNAQPHRKHANAKNRPWHPRASRPRLQVNRKPTYRPVASGATFLVDTANLIGAIGPEHAAARPIAPARRAGLKGCVDARLAAGDGRTAVKLLARAARKDPSAYAEMSRIYEEGDGLAADARMAKRYARLAKKEMKAARQTARRQKQVWTEFHAFRHAA